jgi:site-specific DNA-methyltransferase (adenine-specific)/adenine-specific DNA-methyltransferase
MPTLNWIGKDAVINHHLEVPFHLLKDVPELSCGDPGNGNLIVEGDNLVALKALLPYYKGKVKCICIDPPYNTGNEGWTYNDNVNSPVIRKWIGDTVGGEGETLDRHDRWLCMIYPRIALLRDFLTKDGSIWVCLDDNEVHALRYVMDEIFGSGNFVSSFAWEKDQGRRGDTDISSSHDHIILYAKDRNHCRPTDWARRVLSLEFARP